MTRSLPHCPNNYLNLPKRNPCQRGNRCNDICVGIQGTCTLYNGTLYTFGPETRLINTVVSAATVIRAGYFMQKFKFIFGTVYVHWYSLCSSFSRLDLQKFPVKACAVGLNLIIKAEYKSKKYCIPLI